MKTYPRIVTILILLLLPLIGLQAGKATGSSPDFEALTWPVPSTAAGLGSGLVAHLVEAQPEDFIPVIVTLRDQIDTSNLGGTDREERLEALVTALQAKAAGTQKPLIRLLDSWQSQGLVAEYTSFWVFNGLAVTATPEVIHTLAGHPLVMRIALDKTAIEPAVDYSAPVEANIALVNAPALWTLGFRGQGVVVATMDTGVYLNHPDLVNQWRGGSNSWFDPYGEHPYTPTDLNGHGTHTMGVILGGDAGGSIVGVAPEARWIAVKIFNDAGQATTSGIHAGFQWLLDPDGDPATADAPHVVNNSWTFASPGCDLEFQLDLQALRAAGILPVFSAGNSGPGTATSMSPANNPEAFAVGATDNYDQIYVYSSRGPSACGEAETIFPEIVAPGVNVRTTERYGLYTLATGTSIAAPHASGGLALLLSAFPGITPSQQEGALLDSAVDLGIAGPDNTFGYGRLDILAAYQLLQSSGLPTPTQTATAEPPTPTPTSTLTPSPTPTFIPSPTVDLNTNLALLKPVWVSSFQDDTHTGEMAVDGDLATLWESKKATGKKVSLTEWIKVDLGGSATLSQVNLEWDASYATTYNLQISDDDLNWTTIFSTESGDGGRDTILLSPVSGRYILLESSAWSDSSYRTWLREFEVYGSGEIPAPTNTPTPVDSTPTPTASATPTATPGSLVFVHSGDLDGISTWTTRNRWEAQVSIQVHNGDELPVAGAEVSGSWSGAAAEGAVCITDAVGQCSVTVTDLKSNADQVTFSITSISGIDLLYLPADNHDPDGDSDGSSITILMP